MMNRYKSRSYECCKREKISIHSCGVSAIVPGRIINGVESVIKQWPWMVSGHILKGALNPDFKLTINKEKF